MATAREESNPYGGLGAGRKFRKKPYRRPQSTPYDRPPTAIRNPTIVPCADGNSWLRKLMDPAHMLLATTARRFYNSVFRKRLTHPPPSSSTPPQLPASEAKQEAGDKHAAAISLNISKEQQVASNGNKKATLTLVPGEGSSLYLEEILKQKTFTRSEIDRLMALLHARVADNPVEVEDKTTDVLPSRSGVFPESKEEVTDIPLQDNGSGSHVISYKAINLSVLDEDVASPADLAKAYMGIRPSKVLPSPILSLAPSSSGHVGVCENGYATPRSRGRPALYRVARTPYSRVHVTSTLKSSGLMTDGYDGPSSTTQASVCNRISGSSKPLKRSGAIFENDIGSGGSMRRIRLKPNLSYQKNWIMSTSEAGEPPSSATKMQSMSGKRFAFAEQSNLAPVSSKSSVMASKILQQLDKIVSPPKQRSSELKLAAAREKASANLSPSKLQGKTLKSLQHIDSPKFLEFMTDNNKPDETAARFMHGSGETSKEKQDKIEQNGPSSISAASDTQSPLANGLQNAVGSKKDTVPINRTGDANLNSLAHAPFCAFKMSAHVETCVVEHKPSAAQASIISEKRQIVVEDKHRANFLTKETTSQDNGKHVVVQTRADFSSLSVLAASSSSLTDLLAIQSPSEPNKAALLESNAAPLLPSSGVKVDSVKDQNMPTPIFGFASNNDFTTTSSDKSPQLKFGTPSSGELTYQKTPPDSMAQSLSSCAFGPGRRFSSMSRAPESDNAEDKKPFKDGAFSLVPDGTTLSPVSTTSSATFTFGIKSANSSNDSTVSAAILVDSNTIMSEKPFSIPSFPVTFNGNSSSSEPSSTITAATSTLPTFRFGSSPSNLVSQASFCTALAPEEAKPKADIGPGNTNSSPFSAANSSLGSSIFRFSATTAPSNGSNQKEGSAITNTATGSAPESPAAGTGVASFIQSVLPSSSSEPSTSAAASTSSSFGLSSAAKLFSPSTSFGSGTVPSSEPSFLSPSSSGLFGQATTTATFSSSLTSKSLSSGFSFGSSSSSSSSFVFGTAAGSTSVSSSAITFGLKGTSSLFGIISTSSTSSMTASTAAFAFGSIGSSSASTAASVFGSNAASTISSPFFGSTGASSGPAFSFTAASANPSPGPTFSCTSATAGPSPSPVFGSSNSSFTFGSPALASNSNTDQMSTDDSMAEDMVQANHTSIPPAPVFGQLQSISPSTGFMLGSNDAAGANAFQFGAQKNLSTLQSPSQLQASGSLDFNAGGGSFSLGTGGGDKPGRKIVKINRNKHRRK